MGRAATWPSLPPSQYPGDGARFSRRLIRKSAIEGVKVSPIWLIGIEPLDAYLERIRASDNRRYGPRVYHEYVREQQRNNQH